VGETANTAARGITDGYTALMVGRSVVAIQAGDIVRMAKYLKGRDDVDPVKIGAVGIGIMSIPLLHAAAFDQTISNVTLIRPMISFRSVVMNRRYKIGLTPREGGNYWHPHEIDFSWGVAGALQAYDLPDLMGLIAPRHLLLADISDQMLETAPDKLVNEETAFPVRAYAYRGAAGNLRIVRSEDNIAELLEWSFK